MLEFLTFSRKEFPIANLISLAASVMLLVFVTCGTASSADIELTSGGVCKASVKGEIVSGDFEKISSLKSEFIVHNGESTSESIVCLDSPGGSFFEGLKIARLFYDEGIGTYIGPNSSCYSVCAIIFMMGRSRGYEVEGINRTLHIKGGLGFHRPYITLENTQKYTSSDVNEAFDFGVHGIFELMNLATLPAPWQAGQMMPPDLVRIMLKTPQEGLHYVSKVEEVVHWQISVDGLPDISSLTEKNLFFGCENMLSRPVARASSLNSDDGYFSNAIFKFVPLDSYTLETVISPIVGQSGPSGTFTVANLRSGYVGVFCNVSSTRTDFVVACGEDQTTDTRLGDCNEQYGMRYGPKVAFYHPQTQLLALSLVSYQNEDAARITECRVINKAGEEIDKDLCLQTVTSERNQGGNGTMHRFHWPSGAVTVVSISGKRHGVATSIFVNGQEAKFLMNSTECVENLVSGNTLCIAS